MEHTKDSIRELISKGELKQAVNASLEYAQFCGLTEISNALIELKSTLNQHQKNWNSGQISYEDNSIAYARITKGLTSWSSRLPEQPVKAKAGKKLLTAKQLRRRLFWAMCIVKVVIVSVVFYLYSTGGFTVDELISTLTILAPALYAYLKVMVEGLSEEQRNLVISPKYVSGPLIPLSYLLLLAYPFLLFLCLKLKVQGVFTYAYMSAGLVLVESAIGALLLKVVKTFFLDEPNFKKQF